MSRKTTVPYLAVVPPNPRDRHRPLRKRRAPVDPRVWLRTVILAGLTGLFGLQALPDAWIALRFGQTSPEGCRIVSVVDGDTVRLYCPDTGLTRARLMGFDTPEVFDPQCAAELTRGTAATWALRKHLATADTIAIWRHGTDRYGRELVRLTLDGRALARTMIVSGHARPYAGGARQGWCG